ncbi:type II toxin-antitoxin system Phd/YefM family antitoxin [Kamptonema cortianum]|uniref:Antitoxin n=1 Tax=Geitlerinema calcuttense NRMC-F 0142 TaxID=2922238 RepID=A0ABT7LX81_9CYAN|nr:MULTISPECIES: type II toxin-antitoxin system Phd/YefM family antitoxin [Cyanophyceae]MDK3156666.1 type II toxin-antitoxin system Phd/YefM family antitoxin [Kamptonema cortianum]MDL5050326.1 type II toxin-antitoxin system Phd/YefM family antitoxin [Oscillatoria amoena NRMC-F 0135]MDL5053403.1 type II toxin-antitoxin system Phd/YefM family antitoxin [Oscillatoria laete-virens NRMC-F 0139]MDL5056621.1 type II toxin-antitoxin system Phd/YefM family antitoxin [Geitlerinema calcuttense NRMC-F 0142
MSTLSVHEAKTHFSKLINRALAGEEIIVAKGKKPVVRIVPMEGAKTSRIPGRSKGLVKWISKDFDKPLSEFEDFMK